MTMFDMWTYMQGVTDEKGNPKLGYFVARSLCQPILLSGTHGSVTYAVGETIEILASNLGHTKTVSTLCIKLEDTEGKLVAEHKLKNLTINGSIDVTKLYNLDLTPYPPGLYLLKMKLYNHLGEELARTLELFYLLTMEELNP